MNPDLFWNPPGPKDKDIEMRDEAEWQGGDSGGKLETFDPHPNLSAIQLGDARMEYRLASHIDLGNGLIVHVDSIRKATKQPSGVHIHLEGEKHPRLIRGKGRQEVWKRLEECCYVTCVLQPERTGVSLTDAILGCYRRLQEAGYDDKLIYEVLSSRGFNSEGEILAALAKAKEARSAAWAKATDPTSWIELDCTHPPPTSPGVYAYQLEGGTETHDGRPSFHTYWLFQYQGRLMYMYHGSEKPGRDWSSRETYLDQPRWSLRLTAKIPEGGNWPSDSFP